MPGQAENRSTTRSTRPRGLRVLRPTVGSGLRVFQRMPRAMKYAAEEEDFVAIPEARPSCSLKGRSPIHLVKAGTWWTVYFASCTLTTSSIRPSLVLTHEAIKIFTAFYVLTGIGIGRVGARNRDRVREGGARPRHASRQQRKIPPEMRSRRGSAMELRGLGSDEHTRDWRGTRSRPRDGVALAVPPGFWPIMRPRHHPRRRVAFAALGEGRHQTLVHRVARMLRRSLWWVAVTTGRRVMVGGGPCAFLFASQAGTVEESRTSGVDPGQI